ncbi:response regulator transcription factor [Halomarina rubra]|uniref:Response regulator transcription factor n=1 Tax=Halomarina rubra TaxID=2071873 RepID=A0ABD6AQN2_9EURY|nr:response regulator [Halomarina rubra]
MVGTVLIVDDDEQIHQIVRHKLEPETTVHAAFDGLEGWEFLNDHPDEQPDLVLLDLMMPQMNGDEVLNRIRDDDRFDDLPVIMLTSMGRGEEPLEERHPGATVYMDKPFSPTELVSRIREAARRT